MRAGEIINVNIDLAIKTDGFSTSFFHQGETGHCQGHAPEGQETKGTDESDRG